MIQSHCPCGQIHLTPGTRAGAPAVAPDRQRPFCGVRCLNGRHRCNSCANPERALGGNGQCAPCNIRFLEAHAACPTSDGSGLCGQACLSRHRRYCNACGRPATHLTALADDGRCGGCRDGRRPAHSWCLT